MCYYHSSCHGFPVAIVDRKLGSCSQHFCYVCTRDNQTFNGIRRDEGGDVFVAISQLHISEVDPWTRTMISADVGNFEVPLPT